MLKLFFSKGSCARASHIALAEAGADYEAIRIDTAAGDQRTPEYLAINPKARVPALVTDRGVVTETVAILAFVAQSYPKARLAPLDDPFAFGQAQAFNAYLASTVHVAYAHGRRASRWADDAAAQAAMTAKVPGNLVDCFTLIEQQMLQGPWVLGEAYSICDPYLFTIGGWLPGVGVDLAQFPKVADHARRMAERPAVGKVLAEEGP